MASMIRRCSPVALLAENTFCPGTPNWGEGVQVVQLPPIEKCPGCRGDIGPCRAVQSHADGYWSWRLLARGRRSHSSCHCRDR